ncbi:MAG: dethiobiotin synthase [Spirochaetales bacterium]|nr:dethiobiotin synthase [Spirochaetales bacterium]
MIVFVTGIDTDVGKTWITGQLLRTLRHRVNAVSMKLVQTGQERALGPEGVSQDIREHRRLAGMNLLSEDLEGLTCPWIFREPASPHWAAQREGHVLKEEELTKIAFSLEERFPVVLCEGAGGILVPLAPGLSTLDLVARRGWPVLIVTTPRLGSINHTLLTIEAVKARGLAFVVVVNHREAWGESLRASLLSTLQELQRQGRVIEIPDSAPADSATDEGFSLLAQVVLSFSPTLKQRFL